jgi:DNA-binding NtrC family response regulator
VCGPLIAEHYARQYARKLGKGVRGVSPSAMEALLAYPWPGNIRELQNVVERAVILARGDFLSLPDFELCSVVAPRSWPTRAAHRTRSSFAENGGQGAQASHATVYDPAHVPGVPMEARACGCVGPALATPT